MGGDNVNYLQSLTSRASVISSTALLANLYQKTFPEKDYHIKCLYKALYQTYIAIYIQKLSGLVCQRDLGHHHPSFVSP